jgi:cytochrome c553
MRRLGARVVLFLGVSAWAATAATVVTGGDLVPGTFTPDPGTGYRLLLEKAYVNPAFDQETFDAVWRVWPEPLKSRAEAASPEERRRLAYARYGLTERPGDPLHRPLQYVVSADGDWAMSCFACHGGRVAGRTIPGLPNTHLALQTLLEDVRATKVLLGRRLGPYDASAALIPHGETHGTTNAVMFSVALLSMRDEDLNLRRPSSRPTFAHHDLDAPPWWHYRRKDHLYVDGFAPKSPRALMQFTLVPRNGPAEFAAWEEDFAHVAAYLGSLTPPAWPDPVDVALAAEGREVFETHCATCHGTYGDAPHWPGVTVPIGEIGTDRARHDAILPEQRARYARSWLTGYDPTGVVVEPKGYVAPPLDGIWASAPYLHNGSVPTLWHLLRPDARPVAWRRTPEGYDRARVGLEVEERGAVPPGIEDPWERRSWFDTTRPGKRAAGHLFPTVLSEAEREAVLEYLKTL